jgi:hypothetical protein
MGRMFDVIEIVTNILIYRRIPSPSLRRSSRCPEDVGQSLAMVPAAASLSPAHSRARQGSLDPAAVEGVGSGHGWSPGGRARGHLLCAPVLLGAVVYVCGQIWARGPSSGPGRLTPLSFPIGTSCVFCRGCTAVVDGGA